MKTSFLRFVQVILAIAILMVSGRALAFDPPPLNGHHVVDQSGRLSADDVRYLDHKLEVENKQTTNEIAVLVISKLNGEDIKDIGYTTFNTWHLGKSGKDNGVLFTIVTDDRKARIDTGKGMGGALTDLQCNDIIKNKIRPAFRAGNLRQAIEDGTSAAANLMNPALSAVDLFESGKVSESAPTAQTTADSVAIPKPISHGPIGWTVAIVSVLGGFGLLFLWMSWPRRGEYEYEGNNYNPVTPPVPNYASPLYTAGSVGTSYRETYVPVLGSDDERTTVPLPTPVPIPAPYYSGRTRTSTSSSFSSVVDDDDDDDDDDSSSTDSSTDTGWDSGSSSDDDSSSGGGGDCGGGGSDDDL